MHVPRVTRTMGPSGGGAVPFGLDSETVSDYFADCGACRRNLEVLLDSLERGWDKLSNKDKITESGVYMRILCTFEVSAISRGRIGIQNVSSSNSCLAQTKSDVVTFLVP